MVRVGLRQRGADDCLRSQVSAADEVARALLPHLDQIGARKIGSEALGGLARRADHRFELVRPVRHRRSHNTAFALAGSFALALASPSIASAQLEDATPAPPAPPVAPITDKAPLAIIHQKLDPARFEWAGFPIIAGSSDIGVQFGVAATFTRFREGIAPYLWNLDVVLSTSLKGDSNGVGFIQQADVLRLDAPDILDHHLRLDTRGSFTRTINEGYYGVGNASDASPRPGEPDEVRLNQYIQEEARIRTIGRVHTPIPILDFAFGGNLRYEWPTVYPGSKLALDAASRNPDGSPIVYGTQNAGLASVAAGVMIDTRDNEFITTRGIFYQLGVGGTVGSAEGVGYAQASAVLSHYAPIGGPLIFATRIVADWEFGHVPFYDLQQGGIFEPQLLIGPGGVRGVPEGRYAGAAKVVGNIELRIPFPHFMFLKQRFRLGTTTFFDAGRVWASYRGGADVAHDGTTLGLRYGIGGGVFLQWGEAAIFRVEAAYSPDAESENPGFPIGIYVSDGLMF